jgi:hypothetical protein
MRRIFRIKSNFKRRVLCVWESGVVRGNPVNMRCQQGWGIREAWSFAAFFEGAFHAGAWKARPRSFHLELWPCCHLLLVPMAFLVVVFHYLGEWMGGWPSWSSASLGLMATP